MSTTKIYKRNLPHIHPENGIFFITFRLTETIPKKVLLNLLERRKSQLEKINIQSGENFQKHKYEIEKLFFAGYDIWLDRCTDGKIWLNNPACAKIVKDQMHKMDGFNYCLIAYTIMPNHVHLLIKTNANINNMNIEGKTKEYPLADTLRLLKGSTARKCNLLLKRNGSFWHHESYDHVVRDEKELLRIIEYILSNPVKAGLAKSSEKWEHSFYNTKFMSCG